MDLNFVKVLTEKGILGVNSKILAHYKAYTLDGSMIPSRGELLVKEILMQNKTIYLIATPLFGQVKYTIGLHDIIEIDGMEPERLGRVFNVNPDGSTRSAGKKRGRKAKIKPEE